MVELVVATAALAGAAALLAAALPSRGPLLTALAVGVLWYGLLLATLGIAGLGLRTLHGEVLTALALGWLALAVAVAAWAGVRPAATRARLAGSLERWAPLVRDPAVALAAILVAGTLAWRVFLALRLPIVDYDGWSYHLVFGDVWIQHDALVVVPQRIWTAGYPANGELLTTWLMAFTHSDAFAGFTSILPIPIGIVAVTGLARALGATRRFALLAGLVFGMTPAMIAQAGTSYRDAVAVTFPVATWWLGLRVVQGDRSISTVALLGIAAGIAVGTKGTNIPLTAPILIACGVVLLLELWRAVGPRARAAGARARGTPRSWVARLVVLGVPVLVLGLVWYARNWLLYGNPLYPFAIGPWAGPTTLVAFAFEVRDLERFPKLVQIALSWAWDWHLTRYVYNLRPGGIGRAWYLILLVAIVGGLWLVRRRQWPALALVVAPAVLTLLTMPMPWYARESLFVPALGSALAGAGATALTGSRSGAMRGATSRTMSGDGRRRAATLGGFVVVAVAAVSLVFVNIRPNIDVRNDRGHLASARQYLGYILSSDERRADVSLRLQCAGFDQIPAGARVVPGGFNLLHAVVGPNLDRILTDPLPELGPAPTPSSLVSAMHQLDATWLVTTSSDHLDDLATLAATSTPGLLVDRGVICKGAHLWELAP
jgi:Dolichyl-phosphate-mannose-protein mannosyltransferase